MNYYREANIDLAEVIILSERDIINIIRNRKRYEAEIFILRDCTDELNSSEDSKAAMRYAILTRRIDLVNHWLHCLPMEESIVVEKHLIEGWAWSRVVLFTEKDQNVKLSCDTRTLQRTQAKAISALHSFMAKSFGDSLDYLIDGDNNLAG